MWDDYDLYFCCLSVLPNICRATLQAIYSHNTHFSNLHFIMSQFRGSLLCCFVHLKIAGITKTCCLMSVTKTLRVSPCNS